MSLRIHAITSEVILNAFQSITEEMSVALVRSAYSTNIKERKDCSCAIFDSKGSLITLAENIPIHLGSMQGLMNKIGRNLKKWNFRRGDILIANDPYLGGGSHLPDITLTRPVYYHNKLVAFVTNVAHWTDVGGGVLLEWEPLAILPKYIKKDFESHLRRSCVKTSFKKMCWNL